MSMRIYPEDLHYEKPTLYNGKTLYQKQVGQHIYPAGKRWVISKSIKGKPTYFGTFKDFPTAKRVRDDLIKNDWDKTKVEYPEETILRQKQRKYFRYIQKHTSGYYQVVTPQGDYCGIVKTIEEALYYRDIVLQVYKQRKKIKKPSEYDLQTDNPYKDNVELPLPENLVLEHIESDYGTGYIVKKGEQSYHLHHGGKRGCHSSYVCACRTYEQAYYVRQEMNKCNWNKEELPRILEEYPVWYTWLNQFYKYIIQTDDSWRLVIPASKTDSGSINPIAFRNVEDALWERDLLVKYDWDEELLIECADDSQNPYYDMKIPPYPQRKIRRIKDREDRSELFDDLYNILQEYPSITQEMLCDMAGVTVSGLRSILKNEFDTTFNDFVNLCKSGEHPNEVLEQKPLIYQPDLTVHRDATNIGYFKNQKSKYVISKWMDGGNHYYGSYPTRELAEKIVKDLEKCNWDRNQLEKIQAKHGHVPLPNSKRWVYTNKRKSKRTGEVKVYSYSIRKKDKTKKMHNYGTYKDKRVAELVRDLLIECDWNKEKLESIQDYAYYSIGLVDDCWRCSL